MDLESEVTPLKLGLRCKPPALTLLYLQKNNKRLRVMPIKFLNKIGSESVDMVTEVLKEHHKFYLEKVPTIRIKKMLRILQETQTGTDIEKASKIISNEYSLDPNQDLNKVSDTELAKKKEIMDSNFLKNQVKVDDPGFQYDLQVDYTSRKKADSGWDAEIDDFYD